MKTQIQCDVCGSTEIKKNNDGFNVCANCGNVMNIENFETNISRSDIDFDKLQSKSSHVLDKFYYRTTLGNGSEIMNSKYKKLQKYQFLADNYNEIAKFKIKIEINRICDQIGIPKNIQLLIISTSISVFNKLPKSSGFRNPQLLAAVSIYACKDIYNYSVSLSEICENLDLPKKIESDRLAHKLKNAFLKLFPYFKTQNNNFMIKTKLNKLIELINLCCHKLKLDYNVHKIAIEILNSNKNILLQTTKNVGAAVSILLALYSQLDNNIDLKLIHVSNALNASCSAVSFNIKRILNNKGIALNSLRNKYIDKIPNLYVILTH